MNQIILILLMLAAYLAAAANMTAGELYDHTHAYVATQLRLNDVFGAI